MAVENNAELSVIKQDDYFNEQSESEDKNDDNQNTSRQFCIEKKINNGFEKG